MTRISFLHCCTVLLFLSTSFGQAVAQESPQQKIERWQGNLDVGVAKLELQIEVTPKGDGRYAGTIISVDQANARIPITEMTIEENRIVIKADSVRAFYEGELNRDRTRATGKWTQLGNAYDLEINKVATFQPKEQIQAWKGTLEAAGREFEFQLRIFATTDGQSAVLDSFNENLMGLPAEAEFRDDGMDFEIKISKARYEGKYNDDRTRLDGVWIQGGGEFPLTFEKIAVANTRKLGDRKRSQTPEKPYPYIDEEISFDNRTDSVTLAGSLTRPRGEGPYPAVILISGSGPQNRDELIFDHRPFLVIADHLTRNGIAVLRFDDRGVGKSTGEFGKASSMDFSRDVEAAIEYLKTRAEIDPDKIGLVGHSEGGIIAPIVAARRDDVAVIVLLAGPGVDGAEISITQTRALTEQMGLPAAFIDAQENMLKLIYSEMKTNGGILDEELIGKAIGQFKQEVPEELNETLNLKELTKLAIARIDTPWLKFFLNYDPKSDLRKLSCPVLALNGEKDLQVLADLNLDAIRETLAAAGNKDFQTVKLAHLNHLFQTCKTGAVTEYGQIEETISPDVLKLITEWLTERLK